MSVTARTSARPVGGDHQNAQAVGDAGSAAGGGIAETGAAPVQDAAAERYRDATRMIERLHRLYLDVIRADLERMGVDDLSAVQALLLSNIGEAEVNVRTLMERGYYQGSNASYNLKKLGEAGYLEQYRSPHDRRATIVRLTDRGRELWRRLEAVEQTFAAAYDADNNAFQDMLLRMSSLERAWTDHIRFGSQ